MMDLTLKMAESDEEVDNPDVVDSDGTQLI